MSEPFYFNSKIEEHAWLSNFALSPMVDKNNNIWPTVEHAYQGMKTRDLEYKRFIRGAKTPWIAKKYGSSCPLRPDWNLVKVPVMKRILREKFHQNEEFRILLLQTEDRKLIHEAPWDGYWGTGPDGSGKNQLGVILMEIRDELREDADRSGAENEGQGTEAEG